MTILRAHSNPQFVDYLRSVLDDANGILYSVDIAVRYFYLSGFAQAPAASSSGAPTGLRWRKSPPAS